MTNRTTTEMFLCSLLMSTGKANIRSMTQLRHFPLLYRDLTHAVRLFLQETLAQPVYAPGLREAGLSADHAEMHAYQRLLFRSLTTGDAQPAFAMDRILARAASTGPRDAMVLMHRFARNLCGDICRPLRRAG